MLGLLILGILLVSVLWKYKKIVVLGFCLLFLLFGAWRTDKAQDIPEFQEGKVVLEGVVIEEPDIRESNTKLTIEIKDWGRVLVSTRRYPEYNYGDKLKISGNLEIPQEFPDFNYQGYLAKEGIYAVVWQPEIELLASNQGNIVYAKILWFKNKLRRVIFQNLSPPHSSILAAIVLGDKARISQEWKDKLNIAGVRHITSISGMHIVILSWILMWLALSLGLWRNQAFYFSIALLILFIIMVGAPASAVRAGIMGGLLLLAEKIGRMRQASRALVIAAFFMLVQNSLLLKFDVGFQLSFLATLGIIYLTPVFQHWLYKLTGFIGSVFVSFWRRFTPETAQQTKPKQRYGGGLVKLLSMTLAAQVFTFPLLVYNFGYFSVVAPLSNLLLVPVVPYVMGAGLVFVLFGLIASPLAWLLSLPVWLLLNYMVKIVDWFSQIPGASLNLEISWIWLVAAYPVLAVFSFYLARKQRWRFLNY